MCLAQHTPRSRKMSFKVRKKGERFGVLVPNRLSKNPSSAVHGRLLSFVTCMTAHTNVTEKRNPTKNQPNLPPPSLQCMTRCLSETSLAFKSAAILGSLLFKKRLSGSKNKKNVQRYRYF